MDDLLVSGMKMVRNTAKSRLSALSKGVKWLVWRHGKNYPLSTEHFPSAAPLSNLVITVLDPANASQTASKC